MTTLSGALIVASVIGSDTITLWNTAHGNSGNDFILFGGNPHGPVRNVIGATEFMSTDPWLNFRH